MRRKKCMNPFSEKYDAQKEMLLVKEAQSGDQNSLEKLVIIHQRFIYNIALKFVRNADDAADLSQEAIIKMITSISQFKGKSSFRTWLYKIVLNHFLTSSGKRPELEVRSFEDYGTFLDNVYNEEIMTEEEHKQYEDAIILVRNNCMTSMLLCLDRQQRLIFILGAIFNCKSNVAARLLGITAENFRKQLSRAKSDLFQFMENKCGLMNPDNPCRCPKKTKGFINDGLIDPSHNQFKVEVVREIKEIASENNKKLDNLMEGKYLAFFKSQPFEDRNLLNDISKKIFFQKDLLQLFRLN